MPPTLCYIRLTTRCNARCQMCSFWSSAVMSMEWNALSNLLRLLSSAGVCEVRFTGGEPLCYPFINEAIDLACFLGLHVSLVTNGSLFDDAILSRLARISHWRLFLSLDAAEPELHDHIRGIECFAQIERVVSSPIVKGKVILNVVLSQWNGNHVPDVVQWAADHGVRTINLIPMKDRRYSLPHGTLQEVLGHTLTRCAQLSVAHYVEERRTGIGGLDALRMLRMPTPTVCDVGRRTVFVETDGGLFPCNCAPYRRPETRAGNIFNESGYGWNQAVNYLRVAGAATCDAENCRDYCDYANRLFNQTAVLRAGGSGSRQE
jgi:MoaA/NifB/PqqE/SkfB family radical SAM enzyme